MLRRTAASIALFAALIASVVLSYEILAFDAWLWVAAPAHAYGLIVFYTMDLILVVMLWRGVRYAGTLSIIMAAIQFLAMAGDLAGLSLPPGVTASAFRSYLLSDSLYVLLLSLQPVVVWLGALYRRQSGVLESRSKPFDTFRQVLE
jgi:hypothetical protein